MNFNSIDCTRQALSALLEDRAPGRLVVVLDNASRGGEAARLQAEFGDRTLVLWSPENIGFARGSNAAAAAITTRMTPDSILFLNSDAVIHWSDVIALDERLHASHDIAAVGPTILYPDHTPQAAGGRIDFVRGEPRWRAAPQLTTPHDVDALHGAVLLVNAEAWREIGAFDCDYYLYSEEADWCTRARSAGWRLLCVPQTVAYHGVRGSSHGEQTPFHTYYWARNRILFMRKRGMPRQFPIFFAYLTVSLIGESLHHLAHRRTAQVEALCRGTRDALIWWLFSVPLPEAARRLDRVQPVPLSGTAQSSPGGEPA